MERPQAPGHAGESAPKEVDWQDVAKKARVKMGIEIREGEWEAGCVRSRRHWDCDCTLICERKQLRVKCSRPKCTLDIWNANRSLAQASAEAVVAVSKPNEALKGGVTK